jgi:hypothetical protein
MLISTCKQCRRHVNEKTHVSKAKGVKKREERDEIWWRRKSVDARAKIKCGSE